MILTMDEAIRDFINQFNEFHAGNLKCDDCGSEARYAGVCPGIGGEFHMRPVCKKHLLHLMENPLCTCKSELTVGVEMAGVIDIDGDDVPCNWYDDPDIDYPEMREEILQEFPELEDEDEVSEKKDVT